MQVLSRKIKHARNNAVKRLLQLAYPCHTEAQLALLALVSTEATKFKATKIVFEEQLLTEARSAEKRPMALYEACEDAAVQEERIKQLKGVGTFVMQPYKNPRYPTIFRCSSQ
jgi:hypothetical protein